VAGGDERVVLVGDVVRDGVHETLRLRHVLLHSALVPQFVRGSIVMRTELPVNAVLFSIRFAFFVLQIEFEISPFDCGVLGIHSEGKIVPPSEAGVRGNERHRDSELLFQSFPVTCKAELVHAARRVFFTKRVILNLLARGNTPIYNKIKSTVRSM
jgi:hypothetical protein